MKLKKGKTKLREQRVSDAQRFYEILNNDNFIFFQTTRPKSIESERDWLKKNLNKKNKKSIEFTIIYEGEVVGGCGIKLNPHRPWIVEVGYFVDEAYWGKGIATTATELMEKYCSKVLGTKRIEALIQPRNKGSIRVVEKRGFKKEGLMKGAIKSKDKYVDAYLFAKTT